ncbi:MAG: MotA/TolQ/ExbB proton channel family protein [Pirellulaceae bacterium]
MRFVNLKLGLLAIALVLVSACQFAQAQNGDPDFGISQAELQRMAAEQPASTEPAPPDADRVKKGSINFFRLLLDGGVVMLPIALMSLLVVAVSFERFYGLRNARIYPRGLRREVRSAIDDTGTVTPQGLFEQSQRAPSAAARIMEDLLQKIGRPVAEIEATIGESAQREAERLYGNVRWLTLAAAVTPLIGLLGTVWGMILAFYETTQLGAGSNKAEYLAGGIYVALVTTLGGLAVAIPAAVCAHYFEGKITRALALIESEFRRMVPRFESFEGRARYDISARGLTRRLVSEPTKRRAAETATDLGGQRRA